MVVEYGESGTKLFDLDVTTIYSQCVHVKVIDKSRNQSYWLTMVYGLNKASERDELWQQLGKLRMRISDAWCLRRDFNAISNLNDRLGGGVISNADIQPMRKMIDDGEIDNLKAKGALFTWNNKQEKEHIIYSRIDRVLINEE